MAASQLYHYHVITQATASFHIRILKGAGSAVFSYKYKSGESIKALFVRPEENKYV